MELYWERFEEAIIETDKQYGRYLHYIAKEIIHNEEDEKAILNDIDLRAWNSVSPEKPNHLKAFLGRITRLLSLNRLEQNKAQKRGGGQYLLSLDEFAKCIPDSSGNENLAFNIDLTDAINHFWGAWLSNKDKCSSRDIGIWALFLILQLLFVSSFHCPARLIKQQKKNKNIDLRDDKKQT